MRIKLNYFSDIERYFLTGNKAKYTYLYTVHPLTEGLPSFCLMCIGTDNKFTYLDVCNRWKLIQEEVTKRGIKIVNFASDGDSRLLKAIKINCHFASKETELPLTKENQQKHHCYRSVGSKITHNCSLRAGHGTYSCYT